jgi:hypothetical protein
MGALARFFSPEDTRAIVVMLVIGCMLIAIASAGLALELRGRRR